jgi:heme oxygenase
MQLGDQLRNAIAQAHTNIETLPLSKALVAGTVQKDEYATLLGQLYHVHRVLEEALETNADLHGIYHPRMNRAEVIKTDLQYFGESELSDFCIEESHRLIEQVRNCTEQAPWGLIGMLYVFEGSRMGSMFLARSLSKGFAVSMAPNQGLDYHLDGIAERPQNWKLFKEKLNSLELTEKQKTDICNEAMETMQNLYCLYEQIPTAHAGAMA